MAYDRRFTSDSTSTSFSESPALQTGQQAQSMILINSQGETRLIETLSDITEQREQWQVVVYNFSGLLEEYKSDYQLRIAMNLANDLLSPLNGGIYLCSNGDMAVLVHNLNPQLERKLTFQLRYLYMDDPLAYDVKGDENPEFSSNYFLGEDFDECFSRFSKQMVKSQRVGRSVELVKDEEPATAKPFNASLMAKIEAQLDKLDILSAMRRQAICARTSSGDFRVVFEEIYMHISHLRQLLNVEVDFLSNPWLFKYLTQLLDARMLTILREQRQSQLTVPISVNINASTLLSDVFTEFDESLNAAQRVAVVFEIPVVDAFADTMAFNAACNHVQKLGYRVCLDGLSDFNMLQMSPEAFDVDLVKLQWNAQVNTDGQDQLKKAVDRMGSKRVILCRCDNQDAIDYGRALGVSLFQGRWLDQQISPDRAAAN